MAKFKYTNKVVTHVSLKVNSKNQEFSFHDGSEYELPDDNEFVKLLVLQGKLVPVIKESKKPIKEQ